MKIFKKNQLAILVISLMLITAGYLNYDTAYNGEAEEVSINDENSLDLAAIGDAELVSSNIVDNTVINNVVSETSNTVSSESNGKEVETNSTVDDYFATSKLERNIMYSQMIERYQEILDSSSSITEQKTIAQNEINKINEMQNAIMITENLLTTKGFNKNIVFVNGDSISVIIEKEELAQEEIAQIQNIVSRELKADVSNIHISIK